MGRLIFAALLVVLACPGAAMAFSPVARFNVVPYQHIGSQFPIGVVAFSKPGIDRVEFAATGQGYSGGTKTASAMTLNSASGTWEYWVTFASSEFATSGAVTITATAYDEDGNSRALTLPMISDAGGAASLVAAWVDPAGSNTTCAVGKEALPCQTIGGAVTKIQAANGGVSDDAVVYAHAGTYSVSGVTASTSTGWLTIQKDAEAAVADVIINTGNLTTSFLKYDSVTLQSMGSGLYVANNSAVNLWTNNCRLIGSGRWVLNSNPVHHSSENHWSTGDYTYDVDYAYRIAALVRDFEISTVGNDAFANTSMIVNGTVDDIDNGTTGWHADVYQSHTTGVPPPSNRIIYGLRATNIHYQGIFLRTDAGQATDNAFVNVLVELREPASQNETGQYAFMNAVYGSWDHLLIRNCTLTGGHTEMYGTYTNSSLVGNVIYQYLATSSAIGVVGVPEWAAGNPYNNEANNNHFYGVYGSTGTCTENTRYTASSWPCPHWYAKRPDSHSPVTATEGDGVLDLTPTSPTFTYPVDGSPLIGRYAPAGIYPVVDLYNVQRGSLLDVGAVEYDTEASPPTTFRQITGALLQGVSIQ